MNALKQKGNLMASKLKHLILAWWSGRVIEQYYFYRINNLIEKADSKEQFDEIEVLAGKLNEAARNTNRHFKVVTGK